MFKFVFTFEVKRNANKYDQTILYIYYFTMHDYICFISSFLKHNVTWAKMKSICEYYKSRQYACEDIN